MHLLQRPLKWLIEVDFVGISLMALQEYFGFLNASETSYIIFTSNRYHAFVFVFDVLVLTLMNKCWHHMMKKNWKIMDESLMNKCWHHMRKKNGRSWMNHNE
jgi:hypothetical protein